jgi:hypothetical protein
MFGVAGIVVWGRPQRPGDAGQVDAQALFVACPIFSFGKTASCRIPSSWIR